MTRYKKAKGMSEVTKQSFMDMSESISGIFLRRLITDNHTHMYLISADNRYNSGKLDISAS